MLNGSIHENCFQTLAELTLLETDTSGYFTDVFIESLGSLNDGKLEYAWKLTFHFSSIFVHVHYRSSHF